MLDLKNLCEQEEAKYVLIAVLLICLLVTLYGGYAFGTLITGAKRMSEGNLNHKIPTKYLIIPGECEVSSLFCHGVSPLMCAFL